MCDCQRTDGQPPGLSRRALLAGVTVTGLAGVVASGLVASDRERDRREPTTLPSVTPAASAVQVAPGLWIRPREDWAGTTRPPKAAIAPEQVKFLLVHHTASSNVVPDPAAVIRQTYDFQTGPQKRWPDICYHFMIGPDGSVWETRAGSLAGPVVADATGGNQGYAQLVCLIGEFTGQPPTIAAQDSLMRTLIWLADRYGIDTSPEATVTFTSRGSDKFRAGSTITTSTISGHRDVTYTACPGNAAYGALHTWRRRVHATRLMRADTGPIKRAVRLDVHLS